MTPEEQVMAAEEEQRRREAPPARMNAGPVGSAPMPPIAPPPGKPNWRADDRQRALDAYGNLSGQTGPVSDIDGTPQVGAADVPAAAQAVDGAYVNLGQQAQGVTARDASAAYAGVHNVQDTAGQQVRAMQMANVTGRLEAAADGKLPTVAQGMLRQQAAETQSQILGQAGQARGNQGAAARRDAMRQTAAVESGLARSQAILGAQEQATARSQLTDAYSNIRGVDTTVAQQDADAANAMGRFNAGQETQVDVGNVDRRLGADQFTAGQQNARDVQVAGVQSANSDRTQQGSQFNAGQTNDVNKFRAGQTNTVNTANADRMQRTSEANLGKNVTTRGQSIQGATTASDAVAQTTRDKTAEAQANKGQNKALLGGLLGAGATVGAAAATGGGSAAAPAAAPGSDRRLKENITPISDHDEREFLHSLQGAAAAYDYIDPNAPGADDGHQYGVIAQELAKSRIGRSVLVKRPDGMLGVQPDRLTMALAGVVAKLAKEAR